MLHKAKKVNFGHDIEDMELDTQKKVKILYVITQDEWGGAQRYVFDLAVAFGTNDEVVVAVGSPKVEVGLIDLIEMGKTSGNKNRVEKIKTVRLAHLKRNISLEDRLAVKEIYELVKNEKPDIVHLNSSKAGVVGSWAINKLPPAERPKVVYTVHGWVFNEPLPTWKKTLYRELERKSSDYKNAIIVLSESDKKIGTEMGLESKLKLIPHGLNPISFLDAIEAKKFIEKNVLHKELLKPSFVTIANAYPTKGLDVLLRAIAHDKKLSHTTLVLIGGGPQQQELEKLKADLGLANVFLAGPITLAAGLLKAFDYFVLPSRKEGLPYVILEAQAAKVPVIATRVGGIPSLIEDKKSGLLVNPDDVDGLANALVYAVEHPEEMKRFAEQAPQPQSLEDMVKATSSLYSTLLSPRQ